jgi:hypothetical protein
MKPVYSALLLGSIGFGLLSPCRADWKPASGPLTTRWTQEVGPERALPEYPRPQMVRKQWFNLNGLWQMAFAQDGEAAPVAKDLNGQILVPFPVESALSGVMKHAERLWYRRTFTIPKDWSGRHVLLHFGAVDWEATVWVNGKKLGVHRGGYDPFTWDITEALKSEGAQELVVGVWDPTDAGTQPRGKQVNKPRGIFYTPTTGIWQTVWLEPVSPTSIASLKIVPDIDAGTARLEVELRGGAENGLIRVAVKDGEQTVAGVTGSAGKPLVIPIANAKLWSPESPFLYDLHVDLLDGATVLDEVDTYLGMRKISVGKDERGVPRLLLNNKPFFQVGPLDQGFWPDGLYTAPTDAALRYDIEVTKKLGFTMARKHVKVEPERWYYWCDRLGLLVWQDMPSGDKSVAPGKGQITRSAESAQQYEQELKAMIAARCNHPCIVMWVVFNEGWGQFDTPRITSLAKQLDPSRLANCASGWNDMKVGDVHDIHVYPGPGAPERETERAGVLGEFGGLGFRVEGHTWAGKIWGYAGTSSQEDLTRKYEHLLQKVWKLKETHGLSAAVYTQTTDVETEGNGLLTYDRALIKVDAQRAAAANRGDFSRLPQATVIVPTSQEKAQPWRYTLSKPVDDWFNVGFRDAGWKEGPGGFGTEGTPGAVVRTEWKTNDIWIRREFTLPETALVDPQLTIHHDEDAEVYLNGVLATKVAGYTTDYEEVPISVAARAVLKPGPNVIAIHCKQTTGGQYIDAGLVDYGKPAGSPK